MNDIEDMHFARDDFDGPYCVPIGSAPRVQAWLPAWVPRDVARYLVHTQAGLAIREIARQDACHPSTVLRQIRRVETRRDDPVIDSALDLLGSLFISTSNKPTDNPTDKESVSMGVHKSDMMVLQDTAELDKLALRVLRRMSEAGAVLAVAEGMETAVVVREGADGSSTRTLSVAAYAVQAMALNMWIECTRPGRIARYAISQAGRSKLAQLIQIVGQDQRDEADAPDESGAVYTRNRYGAAESPVIALARRKDRDGSHFLDAALVTAAERLREDFELAQMGPRVTQNWDSFLTVTDRSSTGSGGQPAAGPAGARARVTQALRFLGPGLGDVALRCCCYLEGLERAEKRMGWSARSGKIVLRIALQRLSLFYETEVGDVLIG